MPSISIGALVRHLEAEWQLIISFWCVFVSLMSYREMEDVDSRRDISDPPIYQTLKVPEGHTKATKEVETK